MWPFTIKHSKHCSFLLQPSVFKWPVIINVSLLFSVFILLCVFAKFNNLKCEFLHTNKDPLTCWQSNISSNLEIKTSNYQILIYGVVSLWTKGRFIYLLLSEKQWNREGGGRSVLWLRWNIVFIAVKNEIFVRQAKKTKAQWKRGEWTSGSVSV